MKNSCQDELYLTMTHLAGNRRQGNPGQYGPWKEILELERFFTLEKLAQGLTCNALSQHDLHTAVVANYRATEEHRHYSSGVHLKSHNREGITLSYSAIQFFFCT
jgi:hypothetical protein